MKRLLFAVTLAVLTQTTFAQRGGAPQTGVNAAMLKMFGDVKAFSANATVRVMDQSEQEISTVPMVMSLRDGKLRAEMDITQAKGAGIPPEAGAMMKQAGLDKMVMLIQPDQKVSTMMFPTLQSYANSPVNESDLGTNEVKTTLLGEEKIDGHPCKKVKLTSVESGRTNEAIVWQATDLKNFPIQMQMGQPGQRALVKFQNPKLEAPEASLFQVPASFTKYDSFQALMQAAMMKMFSGQGVK
jgi:hypothetical protein